jgi:type VI secretion system VasD/TssJ family lipoprotein
MGTLLAVLVIAGSVMASCAKVPVVGGPPMVNLELEASESCNACGRDNGYPLTFRLLQVSDLSLLTGISLAQLWDREESVFGDALIATSEDVIDPGTTRKLKIKRSPEANAVILVGNFCQSQGTCWHMVQPLKGGGSTRLKVVIDETCMRNADR